METGCGKLPGFSSLAHFITRKLIILKKVMLVTFRQFFQTLTFLGNYSPIPEILVSINGMGCGKLSGIIGYAQKFLSKYLRLSKSQIMFFFVFF